MRRVNYVDKGGVRHTSKSLHLENQVAGIIDPVGDVASHSKSAIKTTMRYLWLDY